MHMADILSGNINNWAPVELKMNACGSFRDTDSIDRYMHTPSHGMHHIFSYGLIKRSKLVPERISELGHE
jgi:hypothetical protein